MTIVRHGTLNSRALLCSIVLHGIAFGAVAWTVHLPRETTLPQKKEPVIATLWSAPIAKPKPETASVSPPVSELVHQQKMAPKDSAQPPAPASLPTTENTTQESHVNASEVTAALPAMQPEKVWGETSPLASAPGAVGSSNESAIAEPGDVSGAVDFDEAMRRAAEKVAASGATQLKSTDLNGLGHSDVNTPERASDVVSEPHQPIVKRRTESSAEAPQSTLSHDGTPDDEVLNSSFDPLALYQQKVAALIQKSLRLTRAPSGSRCVMGIQIMNNGLIVESYQLGGDPGLCDDAIKATARVGALPPPPKELGEGRFHNLRVSILF